jgi:hypothetical protein
MYSLLLTYSTHSIYIEVSEYDSLGFLLEHLPSPLEVRIGHKRSP